MPPPREQLRSVARSVDAPAALIPVLADLFDGIESLGSLPRRTAAMLGRAGLRRGARVLDLACGKGAFAIELAGRGWRVTGVDGFEPFIAHARRRAAARGLSRLCEFRVGNVRREGSGRVYDAASMLGLLPLEEAAPLLRRRVRPGGVYVVDDLVLVRGKGGLDRAVLTRAQAAAVIEGLGDRVEEVHVPTPAATRRLNAWLYRRLSRRARAVGAARPALVPALRRFLAGQRRANTLLQGRTRPAVWLVRRGR